MLCRREHGRPDHHRRRRGGDDERDATRGVTRRDRGHVGARDVAGFRTVSLSCDALPVKSRRYTFETNAELPRPPRAGQERDRRDRTPRRARQLEAPTSPPFVDVRERDEWDEGHIPGAVHIPRGSLESRIEQALPDRDRPIVVYCAERRRSAFATKTLEDLGYANVVNLAGGFTDWKRNGFPTRAPPALAPEQRQRYSRHLLIPEVGEAGPAQAARLARPADRRRRSRLARVALPRRRGRRHARDRRRRRGRRDEPPAPDVHSTDRLGEPKAESAKRTIEALNPDVQVVPYRERLTSENVDRILGEGWDVIVDGADNFPTRYLLNDASVWHDIPVVHGSIFRFEGQVTVFKPREGPCYRCLFPQPPPPELAPSCAEGGVLGVLPGIIGSLQANEALKLAARRSASRSSAGCCCSTRSTRPSRRSRCGATRPARSAASSRRSPSTSTTSSSAQARPAEVHCSDEGSHPADAAAGDGRRARGRGERRHGPRPARRPDGALPGLGQLYDGELAPFVNVYVDGEDVRTLDGLDTAVRERRDGDPAPGHGRWLAGSRPRLLDLVGNTPLVELPRLSPEAGASASTRSSRARTRPARSRTASPRR